MRFMYKISIIIFLIGINIIISPIYTGEHSIRIQSAHIILGVMVIAISIMEMIIEKNFGDPSYIKIKEILPE